MDDATQAKLRRASSEINAVRSTLDVARAIEYQRREDIALAVIRFARSDLPQLDEQTVAYKAHRDAASPFFWLLGATLIGGAWHYLFSRPK